MKILFCCAGGMSTGLIVKKMEKWAKDNNFDLSVHATGINGWENKWKDYDCILVGPQIRYAIPKITAGVSIPVAQIQPKEYGMQDINKILGLAFEITGQEMPK